MDFITGNIFPNSTPSLLSSICWQIFLQPTNQQPNKICQKWFTDTIDHCFKSFTFHEQGSSWLFYILPSFMRENTVLDVLSLSHSDLFLIVNKTYPEPTLNKTECTKLIYRVSKDYGNIASQLSQSQTIIMALSLICTIFMFWIIAKSCRSTKLASNVHPLCEHCKLKYTHNSTQSNNELHIQELINFIHQKTIFKDLQNFLDSPQNTSTADTPPFSTRSFDSDSHSNATYRVLPSRIPVAQTTELRRASTPNNNTTEMVENSKKGSDQSVDDYESARELGDIEE